jgi:phosphoglycerol geranylgeranyltransferase
LHPDPGGDGTVTIYEYLLQVRERRGAGLMVLLDPDRHDIKVMERRAIEAQKAGCDALLIGSSLLTTSNFDAVVQKMKRASDVPVILFPGGVQQISAHADAILFLSLLSGRNPQYLIGDHVQAAPIIQKLGLEPIPTGYILIESGTVSTVQYISQTNPIPRDKLDIVTAHALAGQYLGMKLMYLEGGSGAKFSVPEKVIKAVRDVVGLPIIVGGGIRLPEEARKKIKAGADWVVIGNILEKQPSGSNLMQEIASAVHSFD